MTFYDKVIPPGQEGKVTISVDTTKYRGVFVRKNDIFLNDPNCSKLVLEVRGKIKSYFTVLPKKVIELNGNPGKRVTKSVRIIYNDDLPVEITGITSDLDDKITYRLTSIKKGKEFRLEVSNLLEAEGIFRGKIDLATSINMKPKLTIEVRGAFWVM